MWMGRILLAISLTLSFTYSSKSSSLQADFTTWRGDTDSVTTNITCAPWTQLNSDQKCVCKTEHNFFKKFDGKLECEQYSTDLMVLDSYCMTYDTKSGTLEVGSCIENCMNVGKSLKDTLYRVKLSPNKIFSDINDVMCHQHFNRTGRLCGKCLPNFYPQAYSYNLTCVPCPEGNVNLWKYFLFSLAPLTGFYFLVLFFKISTTSSHLHGYIIFAQAVALPQFARIFIITLNFEPSFNYPIKFLGALYGLWNLDFFRMFDLGVCLDMSPLSVIALDYITALYPFFLTVISYFLIELHDRNIKIVVLIWKPFRCLFTLFRRNWDIRTSVIDVYATFFQLSCFKILCISCDLLIPTIVYTLEYPKTKHTKLVLYYDGTVDYFGREHLPYAVIALTFTFLFAVFPIFFLFLFPCRCFQNLMSRCHCHSHIIQTFVDSLNGCYKDGTEPGTRDCRWLAAFELLVRIILFIVFSFTLGSLYFPLAVLIIVLIIILICNIQPHKTAVAHYTKIDITFYCLLGLYYTAATASGLASIKARFFTNGCYVVALLIGIIPLIYMTCLSLHWIFTRRRWGRTLINRLRAWKRGYHSIDDLPDRILHPDNYEQGLKESASLSSCSNGSRNWYNTA